MMLLHCRSLFRPKIQNENSQIIRVFNLSSQNHVLVRVMVDVDRYINNIARFRCTKTANGQYFILFSCSKNFLNLTYVNRFLVVKVVVILENIAFAQHIAFLLCGEIKTTNWGQNLYLIPTFEWHFEKITGLEPSAYVSFSNQRKSFPSYVL